MTLGFHEKGEGPVLLLIHGFPLDATMWTAQLEGLSDTRRVVAVDLPGRGASSHISPDGATVDSFADAVAETIESLGEDQVDLAGLSMGGYVAFAFLRRHSAKVRSLALIDTKADEDPAEAKEGRTKMAEEVLRSGMGPLVEGLLPKLIAPGTGEGVKAAVAKMFENTPPPTAAADAGVMRDRPDSNADLGSISVPTIVIHGAEDALIPPDIARKMSDAIPGARFVAIEKAGHLSPIENPEGVNTVLRDFLTV